MKFSLNLNKIALLRNARGENNPSLEDYAHKAIDLGVDGLTLHPRPDHRHATSEDVISLNKICICSALCICAICILDCNLRDSGLQNSSYRPFAVVDTHIFAMIDTRASSFSSCLMK